MRATWIVPIFIGLALPAIGDDAFPSFQEKVIDPNIGRVCYAVTVADVDGDSRPDIVAVSESRVLWYENPTWKPRTILDDQTSRDNVCIAPWDIDGDGSVDFALGAGWTTIGTIHWLRRGELLEGPWEVYAIGEERWLHRMRFADVLGKGRPQLVISPLNATVATGVRLTAFEIPEDPVGDRWPPTILNNELDRMHNHWHVDHDNNGIVDTLTASREGVHLIGQDGGEWTKIRLGTGASADDPDLRGAGEIKSGRIQGGARFIATVEPMHGTSLVVYTEPSGEGGLWDRHVIDEGFQRGHALWTADLDDDGSDEIVFGHSDTPKDPGVNVYESINNAGTKWQKHVVDAGGMATEDLIVADLTGDGRPDIVAGGRSTHNVKLYVNVP